MSEASTPTVDARPRCQWRASADQTSWATQAADAVAQALATDLQAGGQALLMVSCGNTPLPVYRELAQRPLDWSRVLVGLVDERWTTRGNTGGHARQIRDNLLTGAAAAARFTPLLTGLDDPELAARAGSAWFDDLGCTPSAIVFGMDEDGHTASLFPRAGGIDHAFDTDQAYAVIDASNSPGAGTWPTRITLTPAAFARARARLLLIHGASKRRVFEIALAGDDAREMPIRSVVHAGHTPLQVHWYP